MKRWAILVSLFLTSVFLSNAVFAACSGTCHTDCGASSECDGKAKGSSWCDHGVFKTCDSNCQYSEVCTSSCGSETLCIGKKPREQWCNGNTYHGCTGICVHISKTCSTGVSDTDGTDYTKYGYCKVSNGCVSGAGYAYCNDAAYIDKCQSYYNVLEAFASGSSCSYSTYDCRNINPNYVCSDGKCGPEVMKPIVASPLGTPNLADMPNDFTHVVVGIYTTYSQQKWDEINNTLRTTLLNYVKIAAIDPKDANTEAKTDFLAQKAKDLGFNMIELDEHLHDIYLNHTWFAYEIEKIKKMGIKVAITSAPYPINYFLDYVGGEPDAVFMEVYDKIWNPPEHILYEKGLTTVPIYGVVNFGDNFSSPSNGIHQDDFINISRYLYANGSGLWFFGFDQTYQPLVENATQNLPIVKDIIRNLNSCKDTDGINFYIRGTTSGNFSGLDYSNTDFCKTGTNDLLEYYCDEKYSKPTPYTCPSGQTCSRGACRSPGTRGGGCPYLNVWNGSAFQQIELLNIHAPKDQDTTYTSSFSMQPKDGKYEIILHEAAYWFWDGSHINSVKLFDSNGEECRLLSAVHSKQGDVLNAISYSDSERVRTYPGDEVKLVYDSCTGNDFLFTIEGYNMKCEYCGMYVFGYPLIIISPFIIFVFVMLMLALYLLILILLEKHKII